MTTYKFACMIAGDSKRRDIKIDYVTMNLLLYQSYKIHQSIFSEQLFNDPILVKDEERNIDYFKVIDIETYNKIIPTIKLTSEEINDYINNYYDENELINYLVSIGFRKDEYDEFIVIDNAKDIVKKCVEKGYSNDITQEICFQQKIKTKNITDDTYWLFNTPTHPFEKYLENRYKSIFI